MRDPGEGLRRLGWTLAGLLAALGPHFRYLHLWVTAMALGICAWRLLAERRGWRLPGAWSRGVIAIAATAGVAFGYRTIAGLEAGTALLTLMAALKLLETRGPRDHVVLIFIGWFLCLAAFFYDQGLLTLAWVLPTVWLLAAALLVVARAGDAGPPLAPFRTTGAMLARAVPIALVLFLFFPRIAGQFWGAPAAERARTGLTDEMSPGDISDLTADDTVAFRVRFAGAAPPPLQRYWRGPVLTEFDGHTWSRARNQVYFLPPVSWRGAPVDYTVTLEPTGQRMLFTLDLVRDWPADMARQSWDYQLVSREPIHNVLQYQARSYPRYVAGPVLSPALRNRHLQLPPGRNPRTAELARRLRATATSDVDYARRVLASFREQEFYYTLTPPGLTRDSVDDFLFNTRRGFCGHFASAFTMLMRAAGVPARVVTGYQGGDWNPIGGYLILRQSHAHAWSEIWLPGRGWTRFDPTAAVAPERVERDLQSALPDEANVPGRLLRQSDLLWQAGMLWDNVQALWNDQVVRFDQPSQERLLQALGVDDPDWRDLALLLTTGLVLALLLVSGWLAWEFRPRRADPVAASYRQFQRRLARQGIECAVGEAPRDFAQRVQRLRPDLAAIAQAITELYLRLRYLPAPAARDLSRLRGLVQRFRP
jgi:transglutaminase-like putative cysteine protease